MAKNEKKKKNDLDNLSYPDLTKELDRKRIRALRRRTEAAQTGEFSFSADPAPFGETAVSLETDPVPNLPEEQEKRPANIHAGHRARLRERFRKEGGFDHFQDHEILELILTYGAPRGDMNGIAHELLDTFGSLKAVFEARPEALMRVRGVGEAQATMIAMAVSLARVWEIRSGEELKRITNRRELEQYCRSMLLGERNERFYVICVDAQCRVLGTRKISEGSLSEVSAYPRSVVETALNYNAHSVFFCHNHPGGTCAPSTEDIASTIQLQRILNGVGVLVLDHVIIAGTQAYSMSAHGDLDFRTRSRS